MKQPIDLSILILNYNTVDWLQNVLSSIQNFPPQNIAYEVIVVDNASKDASVEMVETEFPHVVLIKSPENGGFAKGNNLGIREANGRFVMLLNSDAEFSAKTQIEECINYLDEHPSVGILTPKLVLPDGSIDLASHRGEPTPWAAFTYFSGLEKLFSGSKKFGQYHQTWQDFNTTHVIQACSGAAMIVRSAFLDSVGLLDEHFFMYAEDLDWCKRFRDSGHEVVYFPKSQVIHHKYKSGLAKEKQPAQIDTQKYLQIPGFSKKKTITNSAKFHFYETMKQYYSKHYQQSSPIQTWFIHKFVDILRWWKQN